MLALRVLHLREVQVDLSHCYINYLTCQAKDLTCQLKVLACVCVSAFTEGIIHTTIIHFKILTLRTMCLKGLVIRIDHSNIKKINLMLNLML